MAARESSAEFAVERSEIAQNIDDADPLIIGGAGRQLHFSLRRHAPNLSFWSIFMT
jgi:hypothetical protein